jgi:hypothetical protein
MGDAVGGQRTTGSGDLLAGIHQYLDQPLGPGLPHLLEDISQFAQMMGVAQSVRAGQVAVGLPAIVYEGADKGRQ